MNTILFTPLVGAILMLFIPRERPDLHRWMGNIFACLGLLVSLPLIWRFNTALDAPRFQFITDHDWIPSIGARYTLGIDGLSFLLVHAHDDSWRDCRFSRRGPQFRNAKRNTTSCCCSSRPACSAFSCRSISSSFTFSGK